MTPKGYPQSTLQYCEEIKNVYPNDNDNELEGHRLRNCTVASSQLGHAEIEWKLKGACQFYFPNYIQYTISYCIGLVPKISMHYEIKCTIICVTVCDICDISIQECHARYVSALS